MKSPCCICKNVAEISKNLKHGVVHVNCHRCGSFNISEEASEDFDGERFDGSQVANISGWIRENASETIVRSHFNLFRKIQTPSPPEKAAKVLRYFAKKYPNLGHRANVDLGHPEWLGAAWAGDLNEIIYLFDHFLCVCKGFLENDNSRYLITADGWAYLEELKQVNIGSQIGFIAMYFRDSLNSLLTEVLEPGIFDAGYIPKRVDKHEHVNKIDDEIVALIRQSKFVVADLTGQRGGVYFETGYALGLGLPVIWLCHESEIKRKAIHFDVRQYNFITWTKSSYEQTRQRLQHRIEAVIGRGST